MRFNRRRFQQVGVGRAQFPRLSRHALLEGDHPGVVLGPPAHLGDVEAGPGVVVVDLDFMHAFDDFFQRFGVDRVGVQGESVEAGLDPGHPVQLFEELRRRHPPRAVGGRLPEEAGEDHLGARVGAFDRLAGDRQQPRVALRRDRVGEVEEVGLVPDLPGPDRDRQRDRRFVVDPFGRVLVPEFAAGAVALDRGLQEGDPGGALAGAVDRQRRRLRRQPARGAVDEGQDLEAGPARDFDVGVEAAPVIAAFGGWLNHRPGDRDPHRFDPAGLHVAQVAGRGQPLRDDAEEAARGGPEGRAPGPGRGHGHERRHTGKQDGDCQSGSHSAGARRPRWARRTSEECTL